MASLERECEALICAFALPRLGNLWDDASRARDCELLLLQSWHSLSKALDSPERL